MQRKPVFMTGGTGYAGGRLIPRLLAAGYRRRAMARSPGRLLCRPWGKHANIEVVPGDAVDLRVCDGLDFWRVVDLEPNQRLLLLAEMKAPGDALLEFKIGDEGRGRASLEMVARFLPRGVAGIAYLYSLLPAHRFLFNRMLNKVAGLTGKRILEGPESIPVEDPVVCRL